jgi:hypothetical protein
MDKLESLNRGVMNETFDEMMERFERLLKNTSGYFSISKHEVDIIKKELVSNIEQFSDIMVYALSSHKKLTTAHAEIEKLKRREQDIDELKTTIKVMTDAKKAYGELVEKLTNLLEEAKDVIEYENTFSPNEQWLAKYEAFKKGV